MQTPENSKSWQYQIIAAPVVTAPIMPAPLMSAPGLGWMG